MFPNQAITQDVTVSGNFILANLITIPNPSTILSISTKTGFSGGGRNLYLGCGSKFLLSDSNMQVENYTLNQNTVCTSGNVLVTIAGMVGAQKTDISITYLPYDNTLADTGVIPNSFFYMNFVLFFMILFWFIFSLFQYFGKKLL